MDSILFFEKNCRGTIPKTKKEFRKILATTAGEIISPKIKPEDFNDDIIKMLVEKADNIPERNKLIKKALRQTVAV
ncbi:MAG TPA: hypothetical protein PK476_00550 [Candidatus Pacearchaeota archaeon]|nr:hypothetical protein [Candidatus Pacearchaeota archaeon]HQM24383.1 hypothetical protein [Candidatus Pacearchaeota archaeon]